MSYAMNGAMGSYYTFAPGQVYSGFGAAAGVDFSATKVWSEWLACKQCYMKDPATGAVLTSGCPACKNGVNTIRAALGQLGFGALPMNEPWGAADQGAYKAWAQSVGLPSPNGMPNKDDLPIMEQQLKAGKVTGTQTPTDYTKVGTTYVPTSAVTQGQPVEAVGKSGVGTYAVLAIAGLAVIGGLAWYKSSQKGKYEQAPRAARVSATV